MADAKGYNVSRLTDYVDINKDALLRSVVLGDKFGDTVANLRKQLGIKTTEKLNIMNVNAVLQDGSRCGWSPNGGTDFSEREISTAIAKLNDEYCELDLLGKFAEYLVKFGAEDMVDNFPFESQILDEIVKKVNKEIERQVWQGVKGQGNDLIDGFLTIAEGADSASTINVNIASGSSVYDAVQAVIMAIPEELLDDAVVFLSPANFRKLTFEMVDKNLYHFVPGQVEVNDYIFPGTSIRVHKTMGLSGVEDRIYASVWDNMVYGTDLMNDKEQIRVWFDDEDEMERIKIRFNFGVNTLFPDAVVLGIIA